MAGTAFLKAIAVIEFYGMIIHIILREYETGRIQKQKTIACDGQRIKSCIMLPWMKEFLEKRYFVA